MDEKTERLRDLFVETTGEHVVTESGSPQRGSIAPGDGGDEASVTAVVTAMRDRVGFETDLDDESLVTVARLFFEGADDDEIATAVGVDAADAFTARLDLHLVAPADRAVPFDAERCRTLFFEGADDAAVADAVGAEPSVVARYRRVVAADRAARRASQRWRGRFAELLTDADLSDRLAASAREDGLRAAIEDLETDVQF